MQQHGIRPDQVSQVRGFADQNLRNKSDPLDPANRRISLIVEYMEKGSEEETKPESAGSSGEVKAPAPESAKPAAAEH